MKSFLLVALIMVQTTAFAQNPRAVANNRPASEIVSLLEASAEHAKLLWYKDVISANSVIMVGWIVNGLDLKASCVSQSSSEETCKVASQVMLHTNTARGNYLVTKEVQFNLVNGVVTGDVTMLQ